MKAYKGPFHLECLSGRTSKALAKEVSRVIKLLKITSEPVFLTRFLLNKRILGIS